jgi:hypothetical protein
VWIDPVTAQVMMTLPRPPARSGSVCLIVPPKPLTTLAKLPARA